VLYETIGYQLTRPVVRPPKKTSAWLTSFDYQTGTWSEVKWVVAKVEWQLGEWYPRVGFIVTNLQIGLEVVVEFYNQRGTTGQWSKQGKYVLKWTWLSCHRVEDNQVRLQLFSLAYNWANFLPRLALPNGVQHWPLTTLRERLIKVGAKIVRHAWNVTFQMVEVAILGKLYGVLLRGIVRLKMKSP